MLKLSPTAEDILASARSLIIAGGYNGFSYADIAGAVGIRKPSIHHHFPTKLDLVREVVTRYREEAVAGMAAFADAVPDPVERLRVYLVRWQACIADASQPFCVCALLANEMPILPPAVAVEVKAYFRFLSDWLTTTLERGAGQGVLHLHADARTEAESFMATVHGAMLSARAYGDPKMFGTVTDPLLARLTASR